MPIRGGTVTSHVTIPTGHNRRLIFLHASDARRHQRRALPQGYRPTLGQPRYSAAELKAKLTVLPGGRAG